VDEEVTELGLLKEVEKKILGPEEWTTIVAGPGVPVGSPVMLDRDGLRIYNDLVKSRALSPSCVGLAVVASLFADPETLEMLELKAIEEQILAEPDLHQEDFGDDANDFIHAYNTGMISKETLLKYVGLDWGVKP
jgi:hypothetical protein